jgi:DNA-binding transcriptional regulator PaaX
MTQAILIYLSRRPGWITLADIVAVTQCSAADLDALAEQGLIQRDRTHCHGPEYRLTDQQRASMAEQDSQTGG